MNFIFSSLFCALLGSAPASAEPSARWLYENADILRAESKRLGLLNFASTSRNLDELNDPALTRVTQEYGPSVIRLDSLPVRTARVNSDKRVWSSYWFPHYERDLFETATGMSPLQKYDLYRGDLRRIISRASATQKDRFSETVARWEGLCDAWSIAAVLLPEPAAESTIRLKDRQTPVTFSVSDQKALLFKSFEGIASTSLQIYGQRFHGQPSQVVNGQSLGWIQPDLFADQFHRFLEVALFEKKKPFVIDHDPSEAVWSEPVDGGNIEIYPVPGRNDQVFVRAYIYPAKQLSRENRDQVGKNEHIREYNYILGGSLDWNRNLKVEYGIWLNKDFLKTSEAYKNNVELQSMVRVDSRRSHPDFVYLVPETLPSVRKPTNPEIDPVLVDFIVTPRR